MNELQKFPEPLVPADVDLRGLPSFMLNADRLLASELVAIGTPAECWAALMLWIHAWKQVPAGSLPDDDRILAAFSKSGKKWERLKPMAMRGFIKCSDGRFYHKVLAEEVLQAWAKRVEFRSKNNDKNERQRRWRERIKKVSAELRFLGVTPPMNASMETLERLLVDTQASTVDASTYASTVDTHVDTVDGPVDSLDRDRDRDRDKERKKERKEDNAASAAPSTSAYAFESGVIRLKPKQFDQWKDAFTHLDIKAELIGLTQWASSQSDWFFAVSGALAKRNREAKAASEKAKNGQDHQQQRHDPRL